MESMKLKRPAKSLFWNLISLSLIAVGVVAVLCAGAEHLAGWYFKPPVIHVEAPNRSCFVLDDPSTGVRGVPNCRVDYSAREFGDVQYRFDANGYRNPRAMDQLDPHAFRIVMTGSSVAFGEFVPESETIAARLPVLLTHETGHPIELYDEGLPFGFTHSIALRFHDVLAARPNLVLWIVSNSDVRFASQVLLPHLKLIGHVIPDPDWMLVFGQNRAI